MSKIKIGTIDHRPVVGIGGGDGAALVLAAALMLSKRLPRRPLTAEQLAVQAAKDERKAWNAAVERRKSEKRAAKGGA